ncbi:hypothetical protein A1O1_08424 [Capronia coronata CBS 617.96]|uniref:Uncharacterized protein n=1 Tax=Capronia coronata CBS 617.96 TaxID=1182541 RepID=W9XIE2_9EURO|nr:uncharacterized protein A1O1_08424 [Capronia coronata CBS 617.96]EXJ80282.1 hypothetical protein A1O1_08424 [Capronia coronata CBS 617.96]
MLNDTYGLTERNHIMVGHSCGATLAFQALQRSCTHNSDRPLPPPRALVGLAGIYDLRLLYESHKDGPYGDIYASFIEGAFGKNMDDWDRASPAYFAERNSEMFSSTSILLVTAEGDELVEPAQRDVMRRAILGSKSSSSSETVPVQDKEPEIETGGGSAMMTENQGGSRYAEMSVKGGHDDMWLVGERMVAAIEKAIQVMLMPKATPPEAAVAAVS